ncbi:MAG TPA: ABC transporter permease [Methylomirabilota bacterium]|jgi:ABC-type dipeptide/oligopeptide/nickel transport system permease subunit|nr:ABC transporter permease [Methylomirabilota bacterium]
MARPLDVEALPAQAPAAGLAAPVAGGARRWWRRFARNRGAVFGLAVFLAIVVMAIFAGTLAPYDPLAQGVGPANEAPTRAHWAGTDSFGRDMLSRIIYGSRIALAVGIVSVLLAMAIGVTLGLVAGYYGGWPDVLIMRVMDGLFAFPIIILAIAMMAVMGFGVKNVIIAVAVGFIAPFARVTRADVLAVKEEPYVEAARLAGVSGPAIIARHVLPNVLAPIIVQAALRVSGAIITEAGLSFLGLGPSPPTPVWGSMIAEGRNFIVMAPHISTIPGIALMVTIVGLNLLGDGLRDTLDPRLRR